MNCLAYSEFTFSKAQRRGIFVLAVLLSMLVVCVISIDSFSSSPSCSLEQMKQTEGEGWIRMDVLQSLVPKVRVNNRWKYERWLRARPFYEDGRRFSSSARKHYADGKMHYLQARRYADSARTCRKRGEDSFRQGEVLYAQSKALVGRTQALKDTKEAYFKQSKESYAASKLHYAQGREWSAKATEQYEMSKKSYADGRQLYAKADACFAQGNQIMGKPVRPHRSYTKEKEEGVKDDASFQVNTSSEADGGKMADAVSKAVKTEGDKTVASSVSKTMEEPSRGVVLKGGGSISRGSSSQGSSSRGSSSQGSSSQSSSSQSSSSQGSSSQGSSSRVSSSQGSSSQGSSSQGSSSQGSSSQSSSSQGSVLNSSAAKGMVPSLDERIMAVSLSDVNQANLSQLKTMLSITTEQARAILDFRRQNGPLLSTRQLRFVIQNAPSSH